VGRIVILCLAFFLLGIVVGRFLLAPQEELGSPKGRLVVKTAEVEKKGPVEKTPAEKSAPPEVRPDKSTGKSWKELERIVASVRIEKEAKAGGVITGEVKTQSGEPLEGVTITVTPNNTPSFEKPDWPQEGLAREVLRFVARTKWTQAHRKVTKTASDGTFRVTDLPEGFTYRVRAKLRGYRFESRSGASSPWAVKPGDHLTFIAEAMAVVTAKLLLPDGTQPEEGEISVEWRGFSSYSVTWKKDKPTILLKTGPVTLSASATVGNEEYSSGKISLILEPGERNEPVVFNLTPRLGIRGRLVFEGGQGPEDMYICCIPTVPGKRPSLSDIPEGSPKLVIRPPNYGYTFSDLKPGTYYVAALWSYSGPVAAEAFVEVADSVVACDLRVPAPAPGTYFLLWVYDPKGRPLLDGVSVRVHYRVSEGMMAFSSSAGTSLIKQSNGSFLVIPQWRSEDFDPASASCVLVVSHDLYGKAFLPFDPAEDKELEIRFEKPAFLSVTIEGAAESESAQKLRVELRPVVQEESGFDFAEEPPRKVPPTGKVDLGPLAPGDYHVLLSLGWRDITFASVRVNLKSGRNEITIPMPELYEVVVILPEDKKDLRLSLKETGKRWPYGRSAKADAEGRVIFKDVPPGKYQITSNDPLGGLMEIEVPAPGPILYEPKPLNALRVISLKPGGLFAQAGLQEGDLVIGVNGKEFKNLLDIQVSMAAAAAKGKTKVMILRDGRKLTVTLDLGDFLKRSPGALGGDFEPATRP